MLAIRGKEKVYNCSSIAKKWHKLGVNIREAQHAESKIDFIHKLKIAAKEAEETEYWLLLCKHSERYLFDELFDK